VFWPGLIGEFMKYLPITLLLTLSASLAMALFFVPAAGSVLGGKEPIDGKAPKLDTRGESVDAETNILAEARQSLAEVSGPAQAYIDFLTRCLRHPAGVFVIAVTLLSGVYLTYYLFGRGTEFFPEIEPTQAALNIHARGDLSVYERDALVREVEERILDMPELESVYSRSGLGLGNDVDEDIVGRIQLRFIDWELRRPADEILDEVRARTADLAGIIVEPQEQESGITEGKPIQLELSSRTPERLPAAVAKLREGIASLGGVIDVTDNRPLPGIDWRMEVDRMQAAKFGLDITTVGSAIQLITNGIMIGEYRPDDADDEVDIRVRFPETDRNISQLDRLTVNTPQGAVPIGNFMTRVAAPRVGDLQRTDGRRVMNVGADVEDDVLSDDKIREIEQWLASSEWDPAVDVVFKGESEDQREAEEFLQKAFAVGLFLIALILVTQFNGFYQSLLILSAIVFSTIGVLIGLLVTDQPFGVVMCGIGVIALAGIVVNNNIVLIDTYNIIRAAGAAPVEAALLTCAQRLRPVMLTTVTTILGLLPMALSLNFDLIGRHIEIGGPSTQWWTQLATAIAGGLTFATLLTLVMTPCMLVLGEQVVERLRKRDIVGATSVATELANRG
jgi:multidrug efflux pump